MREKKKEKEKPSGGRRIRRKCYERGRGRELEFGAHHKKGSFGKNIYTYVTSKTRESRK